MPTKTSIHYLDIETSKLLKVVHDVSHVPSLEECVYWNIEETSEDRVVRVRSRSYRYVHSNATGTALVAYLEVKIIQ